MKKLFVEVFITQDGEDYKEYYECESYEITKNWTGNCIRLEDVNTYKETKTGKVQRKQLKRGRYVTTDCMKHWESNAVYVWENGTDNLIAKWES